MTSTRLEKGQFYVLFEELENDRFWLFSSIDIIFHWNIYYHFLKIILNESTL